LALIGTQEVAGSFKNVGDTCSRSYEVLM